MNRTKILLLSLLLAIPLSRISAQTTTTKSESLDSIGAFQKQKAAINKQLQGLRSGVAPFGDTLFYISSRIGSFSPKDRALAITKRIQSLNEAPFFDTDSMRIVENELSTDIVYSPDLIIHSITDTDAAVEGVSRLEKARNEFSIIKGSIEIEREKYSLSSQSKRFGWIMLILALMSLIIYLINRIFRLVKIYLRGKTALLHESIKLFHFHLFDRNMFESIVFKVVGILRIFLILVVLLVSFSYLFSLLPVTRTWTVTMLGWVLTPLKAVITDIWLYLPKLFSIIVIYLIFKYTIQLLDYIFSKIADGSLTFEGFHHDWAQPTFSIIRFLLYAFMLVLIFPKLPGSESDAFKGVSVFLGILISLGSSSVIGNILAGLVITYMRPFKIGDRIKIGEMTGDVIEKTALVTRIRTVKNEDITVPNSTILSSSTINYTANSGTDGKGLIVHTTVSIGYEVPWRDVHKALLLAADRTETIQRDPAPFVLQTSLDDFNVSYQLNGYTKEVGRQALVYSTLHQNIQDCCNEAGIEIMSPHYSSLRDGNRTTIPSDYLPEEYQSPSFRVEKN